MRATAEKRTALAIYKPIPFSPPAQNGTGKQTRWHMDKVVLTNISSSASSTFLYRNWVTVDGDKVSVQKDMHKADWKVRGGAPRRSTAFHLVSP